MITENSGNEFTVARVRKYLTEVIARLDQAFKASGEVDNTKAKTVAIVKKIQADIFEERRRALVGNDSFLEACGYIAALNAALGFIELGLDSESQHKFSSCLYGASLLVGFYLHQMHEPGSTTG